MKLSLFTSPNVELGTDRRFKTRPNELSRRFAFFLSVDHDLDGVVG